MPVFTIASTRIVTQTHVRHQVRKQTATVAFRLGLGYMPVSRYRGPGAFARVSMGTDHKNRRLWPRLQAAADEEVEALVRRLPAELRDMARTIPVTYEPFPTQAMVDDDKLDPDLLGLFVGDCYAEIESGATDLPPQILLFLMSIWDYAGHRAGNFRKEVRRTYLHELGHYLGLDEGDLEVRDLD